MIPSGRNIYRHSGRLGSAPLFVPLIGLPLTVLFAVIYAYVTVYSPIGGYISFIFVGLFAFGVGITAGVTGLFFRCRNVLFLRAAGLALGIVAFYVSWAVFEYALLKSVAKNFNASVFDVLLDPRAIWNIAVAINKDGWFTMGGITPSGIFLWVIWAIEGLVIVAGPVWISALTIDDEVFCEPCNGWCDSAAIQLGDPDDESIVATIGPDNLEPLLALKPVTDQARQFVRIKTWECPSCDQTTAIQIERCTLTEDEDGDISEETEKLTPIELVDRAMLEGVRSLAEPELAAQAIVDESDGDVPGDSEA